MALYAAIESAWLTFPSTPFSSGSLAAAHLILLLGLLLTPFEAPSPKAKAR